MKAATPLVVRLFDQLHRTVVLSELKELARYIAWLAAKARSDRVFAILILGALKYPLAPPERLAEAVRSRFRDDAPGREKGFWALIGWARQRFSDLDLKALQESKAIETALLAESRRQDGGTGEAAG